MATSPPVCSVEETQCFAFLAGHESFAAAEGAIKIAEMADEGREKILSRVILNGLGKDACPGFSAASTVSAYVQTKFDYYSGKLEVVKRIPYSDGPRAKVNCYGADDVREGVAINWSEDVDVSITGNSTNPTRFQHPGRRNLQEGARARWQALLLCSFRWWYRPYTPPRQHGCRLPLLTV